MFSGVPVSILISLYLSFVVAELKQECITSNWGYGDTDPGEIREPDEMGGGMHGYMATGQLTCSYGNGGSILVIRVSYGLSVYPGRCHGDGFCGEEIDTSDAIATRCNGQTSCNVDLRTPLYLKCGRMSNYMLVEYECLNTWATFDVCRNVSTLSRDPSVYITSPGYLESRTTPPARGTTMCECIIRSQDRADLYLDYLQTKLSSERQTCPYEYVLLQNKKNINQSSIDNELEVCGERQIAKRWFTGTVRIIMASGGAMQKRGLLAKITADNLGHAPRLDVECGIISSSGVNLQERPVLRESIGSTITRSRINPDPLGMPIGGGPYPPMRQPPNPRSAYGNQYPMTGMDDNPYEDAHERHNPYDNPYDDSYYPHHMTKYPSWQRPTPPPPGPVISRSFVPDPMPPPRQPLSPVMGPMPPTRGNGFLPDITRLKINLPGDKMTASPPIQSQPKVPFDNGPRRNKPNADKKPNTRKPVRKGRTEVRNEKPPRKNARNPSTKKGAGRIVNDPGQEESVPITPTKGNGGAVALVFGGVGAVLILGSVSILALHNYRKRQRIKREEAEYAYSSSTGSSYGRGWPKECDEEEGEEEEESVYATVKEVDLYRESCVNPSGGLVTSKETSTHIGKENINIMTCAKGTGNERCHKFAYDGPAANNVKMASRDDIAVIEIHQPFDGTPASDEHQHDTDCLQNFGYTSVDKKETSPYCKSCDIRRPPRRTDKGNGYDNNISIRSHRS